MRRITSVIALTWLGVALLAAPALAAPGGVPGRPSNTPAPPAEPGRPPEPGSGTPGTPVEISIADHSVTEGGTAQPEVTLSSASANDTTVDWATADGTAGAADYTGGSGTLTIPAGQTSGTIDIATTGDADDESDETFTIALSNPSANATILDGDATVTILDDDDPAVPHAAFDPTQDNVSEGELGVLTIVLSFASQQDVSIDWQINAASTATAGDDYVVPSSTTTVILAGETSGDIEIQTIDDTDHEQSTEGIIVNLLSATGATVGGVGSTASIRILGPNDEPPCVDDGLDPVNDTMGGATPHDSEEFGIASTVCPDDVDWWKTTVGANEEVVVRIEPDNRTETDLDGTALVAKFWADGAAEPVDLPDCDNFTGAEPGCYTAEDLGNDGGVDAWSIQIVEPTAGGVLYYSIALPSTGPADGYDYVLPPVQRNAIEP